MMLTMDFHLSVWKDTVTLYLMLSCHQMASSHCLDPGTRPWDYGTWVRKWFCLHGPHGVVNIIESTYWDVWNFKSHKNSHLLSCMLATIVWNSVSCMFTEWQHYELEIFFLFVMNILYFQSTSLVFLDAYHEDHVRKGAASCFYT